MSRKISDVANLTGEMGNVSVDGGDQNESTPPEQRTPTPVAGAKLDSGPKVGAAKQYLPAMYRTDRGNIRQDR